MWAVQRAPLETVQFPDRGRRRRQYRFRQKHERGLISRDGPSAGDTRPEKRRRCAAPPSWR
jgi:hypothetical protein